MPYDLDELARSITVDALSLFIAPRAFNLLPASGKAINGLRELVKNIPELTEVVNQSFNTDKPE